MIEVDVRKKRNSFLLEAKIKDEGAICVVGKNGAGKTTLLSVISGIMKPDIGTVKVNGRDVTELAMEKRGVVLITQDSYIPNLTVESHLRLGIKKGAAHTFDAEMIKQRLQINQSGKVGELSAGTRVRIAVATALLSDARVLCVDEAFEILDNKQKFLSLCGDVAKESGKDLIFTTQKLEGEVADHIYEIKEGITERIK